MKVKIAGVWVVVAVIVAVIVSGGGGGGGFTCNTTISSGTSLQTAISGMTGGQTLCLSSGTFTTGTTLSGINPTSTVTIRPASGATVLLPDGIDVNASTSNLRFTQFSSPSALDGWSVSSAGGTTRNIEFDHITDNGGCPLGPASCGGQGMISTRDLPSNANVHFDHNTINGVSASNSSQEGSIQLANTNACQAAGANPVVTIEHNTFDSGLTDGIQIAGDECRDVIQYNQFLNKTENDGDCTGYSNGCPHVDSIQGNSDSTGLVIRGNYFRSAVNCFISADGSYTNMTFTDNVCTLTDPTVQEIQAAGWIGGTVTHNTVFGGSGSKWDATHQSTDTSGLDAENNLFSTGLSSGIQSGGGQFATFDHNMGGCMGGTNPCTNQIAGSPTFQGGATPSTWAGYKLTSGSAGHLAASDGTDIGASFAVAPGP